MHDIKRPTDLADAHLLVIRFSSFGDIIQAAAVPSAFRARFPHARVDWLVRADFRALLQGHPEIESVLAFERTAGLSGLLRLAWKLGAHPYTHIYDAHANVRSALVVAVLALRRLTLLSRLPWPAWTRRPKSRVRRLLFFRLRLRSVLPSPYRGVISFLKPLESWGVAAGAPRGPQFFPSAADRLEAATAFGDFSPDVILIPSAAWALKRWPLANWKRLIELMPETRFAVLGGPEDTFCADLERLAPDRVRDFAGKMKLAASSAALARARLAISGDTGLLHVADQMGLPCLALIGPTAFGYPTQPSSLTLEVQLPCKPCSKDGRGKCVNPVYQRCLVDLSPDLVAARAQAILADGAPTDKRREPSP